MDGAFFSGGRGSGGGGGSAAVSPAARGGDATTGLTTVRAPEGGDGAAFSLGREAVVGARVEAFASSGAAGASLLSLFRAIEDDSAGFEGGAAGFDG